MALHKVSWVAAVLLACACSPNLARQAAAQAPAHAPTRISSLERAAALKAIKVAFQESYVFPEMRGAIVERLSQAQQAGRYDLDDPAAFADRITEDLKSVSHDLHLSLRVDPAAYTAALAPPRSDDGQEAFARRQAIRDHHGLAETKILPGNIRYLKITGFEWVRDETGVAYDDAMRFLKQGDAVVIDLRGNGGGSHAAVRYLVSHFLDEDTLELTFLHGSEAPSQSRTLEHLPAGRLKGKPLYVLIDGLVASAAEAFAYDVQQFQLGELVGARTVGAANNNTLIPVAPSFMLSVSMGRPVHAISKTNWEGVGVGPTVETAPAQALDVAQALALKRLAAAPGTPPENLAEYAWARIGVEARLHPVSVAPPGLTPLAGRYGEVDVAFREGALWLTRPRHRPVRLSPLTADGLFAVEGYEILRVRLTGKTLELLWSDEAAPRVFVRG